MVDIANQIISKHFSLAKNLCIFNDLFHNIYFKYYDIISTWSSINICMYELIAECLNLMKKVINSSPYSHQKKKCKLYKDTKSALISEILEYYNNDLSKSILKLI